MSDKELQRFTLQQAEWEQVKLRQLGYEKVVHCRDCQHWETGHDGFPDLEGKEDHECSKGHGITAGVFFCGSGEQK